MNEDMKSLMIEKIVDKKFGEMKKESGFYLRKYILEDVSRIWVQIPLNLPNKVEKMFEIDGKEVFKLHDTIGLPSEISTARIYDSGGYVNWKGFTEAALEQGWTIERIFRTIEDSISDYKDFYYSMAKRDIDELVSIAKGKEHE